MDGFIVKLTIVALKKEPNGYFRSHAVITVKGVRESAPAARCEHVSSSSAPPPAGPEKTTTAGLTGGRRVPALAGRVSTDLVGSSFAETAAPS